VLLILGGMGWFGVPLDIATVMVASITLGLVVDDTIHTLAHYRELRAELGSRAAVADGWRSARLLADQPRLASGFAVCARTSARGALACSRSLRSPSPSLRILSSPPLRRRQAT
jgi:hypothetical protein